MFATFTLVSMVALAAKPVRSTDAAVFTAEAVQEHLAPVAYEDDKHPLAYVDPADTIPDAMTAWAREMPPMIQEIVKDKVYHASGFQLASTLIIVGDDGLIIVDPGENDDSAIKVRAAFKKANKKAWKKPVKAVLYTHRHPDHAFGSAGWGVTEEQVSSGAVKIIASENFVRNLIGDTGVMGPILTQRTAYASLYVPMGPEGSVEYGIGPSFTAGEVSLFLPTDTVPIDQPLSLTVSGVELEVFSAYGDAGTDEVDLYLPQYRHVHGSETIQGESFPNLYTLRGTSYRDVVKWYKGVDALLAYAEKADSYSGSHMRAWMGNDFIVERVRNYRDAIQYVHDQAVYYINRGYRRDELPGVVVLPEPLKSDPWLMEYYGTVDHAVRNIYNGYLGWYSGDATELARPNEREISPRYVSAMGGAGRVMEMAAEAVDQGEYGWAAEMLTHLTRSEPDNMDARKLKAKALRTWAFKQTNMYWRTFGLSGAAELDGSIDRDTPWDFSNPAIIAMLPAGKMIETFRVRINADRAKGQQMTIAFEITDTKESVYYEVRNQIAVFRDGKPASADAVLSGTKAQILAFFASGKLDESLVSSGDGAKATAFIGLFDAFAPNKINIQLPN